MHVLWAVHLPGDCLWLLEIYFPVPQHELVTCCAVSAAAFFSMEQILYRLDLLYLHMIFI